MGKDQQAATMDVDAWKAFGGTVDGKVYVAPSGEHSLARLAPSPRVGGARTGPVAGHEAVDRVGMRLLSLSCLDPQ